MQRHVRVAHLAVDLRARRERGDGVDHDEIDGAGADQGVGDLEALLTAVGLRYQQVL
jgi:hypothetical protein